MRPSIPERWAASSEVAARGDSLLWTRFGDEQLSLLVDEGLGHNYNLQEAAARLEAAAARARSATLANARARRRLQEAVEGLSVDAEMKALEGVREHIARISTEGILEREVGDVRLRTRVRAIRDEVREESARRELLEMKAQLHPELAEKSADAETVIPVDEPAAAVAT